MKLLITGGSGFLGSRLIEYYSPRCDVTGVGHQDLDILDLQATRTKIKAVRPDIVIHCAAVSDTWYAEQHPEESWQINVVGSENIARAAREAGARLIYMSSDQIYNGHTLKENAFVLSKDAQREEIDDLPSNAYARQKQEAEKHLLALDSRTACLRLSWMFDLPRPGKKTNANLLWNLLQAEREGRTLAFATHEYRGVSYVKEVVEKLEAVFAIPGGVYNFGCENAANSYQLAQYAAQALHCKAATVQADNVRFADAPRNLVMSGTRLAQQNILFSSAQAAICRCAQDFAAQLPQMR